MRLTNEERLDLRIAVDRMYAIPAPKGLNDLTSVPSLLDMTVERILLVHLAEESA